MEAREAILRDAFRKLQREVAEHCGDVTVRLTAVLPYLSLGSQSPIVWFTMLLGNLKLDRILEIVRGCSSLGKETVALDLNYVRLVLRKKRFSIDAAGSRHHYVLLRLSTCVRFPPPRFSLGSLVSSDTFLSLVQLRYTIASRSPLRNVRELHAVYTARVAKRVPAGTSANRRGLAEEMICRIRQGSKRGSRLS